GLVHQRIRGEHLALLRRLVADAQVQQQGAGADVVGVADIVVDALHPVGGQVQVGGRDRQVARVLVPLDQAAQADPLGELIRRRGVAFAQDVFGRGQGDAVLYGDVVIARGPGQVAPARRQGGTQQRADREV